MNEIYRRLIDKGWHECKRRLGAILCIAGLTRPTNKSSKRAETNFLAQCNHNDSWNEMQFCNSNTADRIPSTNKFALAKLIGISMKLMRVNEAHHSGLVPERIAKIKFISHWSSELQWYSSQQRTTNKAPSLKTSNWPFLEIMPINEVDNKEFVPKGFIAFIIGYFEVTQIVLQENRRPE